MKPTPLFHIGDYVVVQFPYPTQPAYGRVIRVDGSLYAEYTIETTQGTIDKLHDTNLLYTAEAMEAKDLAVRALGEMYG